MSANISLSAPLSSPLTDKLPFHNFLKVLDNRNVKSKPFFLINNAYASSFTECNILFILESFLLFSKLFLYQNFFYLNIWEVYYVIYFFQFLKPFPDGVYLVKTMETWVCEICQICMKISKLNLFKVNNKSTRIT